MDSGIGVHIIDRWTYYALEFLEKMSPASQATVADFVSQGGQNLIFPWAMVGRKEQYALRKKMLYQF